MKKIFLILFLINSVYSKEVKVYEINDVNNFTEITKIKLLNNDNNSFIRVTESIDNLYIEQIGEKYEYIYSLNGSLISKNKFMEKSKNSCVSIGKDNILYKSEQIFKNNTTLYRLSKKEIDGVNWDIIDSSKNDTLAFSDNSTILKQKNSYYDNKTRIYKKDLNSNKWEKLFDLDFIAYLHDKPVNNVVLMQKIRENGNSIFYKVKNNKTVRLGEVKTEEYSLTYFTLFNKKPELLLFKNKKIYKLSNDKITLIKDFSNDRRIDYLSIANEKIYGIKQVN